MSIERSGMSIDVSTQVSRTPDLMTTAIEDELVILNMTTNSYVALDSMACRIWGLLASPLSVAELCDRLESEFEAPEGAITRDVVGFLQGMEQDGLVQSQQQ